MVNVILNFRKKKIITCMKNIRPKFVFTLFSKQVISYFRTSICIDIPQEVLLERKYHLCYFLYLGQMSGQSSGMGQQLSVDTSQKMLHAGTMPRSPSSAGRYVKEPLPVEPDIIVEPFLGNYPLYRTTKLCPEQIWYIVK